MLKQFYSSILSITTFLFSVIVLCILSFNWSSFKKIYDIDEINIYGTNFFDQSIIEEKSDVLTDLVNNLGIIENNDSLIYLTSLPRKRYFFI